jgi:hypothetical protein
MNEPWVSDKSKPVEDFSVAELPRKLQKRCEQCEHIFEIDLKHLTVTKQPIPLYCHQCSVVRRAAKMAALMEGL